MYIQARHIACLSFKPQFNFSLVGQQTWIFQTTSMEGERKMFSCGNKTQTNTELFQSSLSQLFSVSHNIQILKYQLAKRILIR